MGRAKLENSWAGPLRMRSGLARADLKNMADESKSVEVVVNGENKKLDTEEDGNRARYSNILYLSFC